MSDCQTGSLQMRHAAARFRAGQGRLQNVQFPCDPGDEGRGWSMHNQLPRSAARISRILILTGLFPAGIAVATPVQASTICQAEQQHLLSRGKQACVSCVWNEANALRAKHGLPNKRSTHQPGPWRHRARTAQPCCSTASVTIPAQ